MNEWNEAMRECSRSAAAENGAEAEGRMWGGRRRRKHLPLLRQLASTLGLSCDQAKPSESRPEAQSTAPAPQLPVGARLAEVGKAKNAEGERIFLLQIEEPKWERQSLWSSSALGGVKGQNFFKIAEKLLFHRWSLTLEFFRQNSLF